MASRQTKTSRLHEGLASYTLDGAGSFTIPAADTDNSQIFQLNLDCRDYERYVQLEFTPGATQLVDATAHMSRAHEAPNNTTLKNQTLFFNA